MHRSFRRDICYSKLLPVGEKKADHHTKDAIVVILSHFYHQNWAEASVRDWFSLTYFFIPPWWGQSSQTHTLEPRSPVHCQKGGGQHLSLHTDSATLNSLQELHKQDENNVWKWAIWLAAGPLVCCSAYPGECPELPVPLSVHYKQKKMILFYPCNFIYHGIYWRD